jgi:thiamine-phosphate pyrophosphorylase
MKTSKSPIDFRLYLVTDRLLSGGRSLENIVRESIAGGVTMVQLREKNADTGEFLDQAFTIKQAASELGIPLVINDRVDIALACRADGVHLGQADMPCALARRIAGKDMIIGVSVSSVEEALVAEAEGADYLGVGPLFPTLTKVDALPATGLDILRSIRRAVRIPLVGIGGLTPANAGEVIHAGADGVAVVSAIIASPDPRKAAREIRSAIDGIQRGPHELVNDEVELRPVRDAPVL